MRTPEFVEDITDGCGCAFCSGAAVESAARNGGSRPRCTVRGAVAAAVGAVTLAGAAAGAASAEPAPRHAGWDGSKYWYKDATGWWRWTSHYEKYQRYAGGSGGGSGTVSGSHGSSAAPARGHNPDPTFRGRSGWDATDRVYWYRQNGSWWWTSHRDRYEARTGMPGGTGGTGGAQPRTQQRSGGSHGGPTRFGTEAAVQWAMAQLGKPYAWGGNGPSAFDCSGLVQQAYQRAGISLPRVADAQYRASTPLTRNQLRRGDLVFWSSNGSASGVHHVAVYLGGGQYLEAPRPGRSVRISSFDVYRPTLYGRVG
ncbi:C40 family peptidase [Streptomyces sp. NRRL F-5755]|uniref:C40 family peptidase n=1 Tax=Streptomyces sp. NRRL F-5755 TaxID=1519475 RepID=UPI0006ADAAA6|nr:C40 family peptidase [Streptomyces sp. NRRL F-5755]